MKIENPFLVIAALFVGFIAGHFLLPRQDRFVISHTSNGRTIKIDRHTGETWRYYRNEDGSQGFTRTQDQP